MENTIIELLESKSFAELSANEKGLVLQEMSEAEYTLQHDLIKQAEKSFQDEPALIPLPSIQANLTEQLQKQKKRPFIGVLFLHKTPTWAAAAVVLIVLLLKGFSFDIQNAESDPFSNNPKYVTDTIYVEKEIVKRDSIFIPGDTVVRYIDHPVSNQENMVINQTENTSFSPEGINYESIDYGALLSGNKRSKGTPLSKDTLSQLINESVF